MIIAIKFQLWTISWVLDEIQHKALNNLHYTHTHR